LKAAGPELVPVADCFAGASPDCHWFGVSIDLEKTVSRIASDRRGDLARRRNRCRNRVHAGPAAYWQLSGEFSMFGRNE
jgi:hypothetical protein